MHVWQAIARRCTRTGTQIATITFFPQSFAWTRFVVSAKLDALHIDKIHKAKYTESKLKRRKQLAERLAPATCNSEVFRLLRDSPPRRLAFVNTPSGLTAEQETVDATAREAWNKVYKGNIAQEDVWSHALQCMIYFKAFIPRVAPVSLPLLTGERVLEAFRAAPTSAPGPDAWHSQELAAMSPHCGLVPFPAVPGR